MATRPYFFFATIMLGCSPQAGPPPSTPPQEQSVSTPASSATEDRFVDLEGIDKSIEEVQERLAAAKDTARKTVVDQELPAAVRFYVERHSEISREQRARLMALLIAFDDARALPAFELSLAQLLGERSERPDDLFNLLRGYEKGRIAFLAPALLDIYPKFHAHTPTGGGTYRAFADALTERPQREWESTALELLKSPVHHPQLFESKEEKRAAIDPYRDQLFWQTTAAQMLGKLRSEKAVRPLLKVLLDPGKSDLATTALLALVKIGERSVQVAGPALLGKDAELAKFARDAQARVGGEAPEVAGLVPVLSAVLGMSGLAGSEEALLQALPLAKTSGKRALIARELSKPPNSEAAMRAFRSVFQGLDCSVLISDTSVCVMLAESAPEFMDPRSVPWLLQQASKQQKKSGEVAKATAEALVVSAAKLATPDQIPELQRVAQLTDLSDSLNPVVDVLKECGKETACYLAELQDPENQEKAQQIRGIKAAYMLGMLGDAGDAHKIVLTRPLLSNSAVHFAALRAVDALLPQGDDLVIETLRFQIDVDRESGVPERKAKNAPAAQILYRLEARWLQAGGEIYEPRSVSFKARLPAELIRLTVRRNFEAFRLCYEQGLERDSKLEGSVNVQFVIARDGLVSEVSDGEGSMPDQGVSQCVLDAFRELRFPRPVGGIIKVTYPIAFAPG